MDWNDVSFLGLQEVVSAKKSHPNCQNVSLSDEQKHWNTLRLLAKKAACNVWLVCEPPCFFLRGGRSKLCERTSLHFPQSTYLGTQIWGESPSCPTPGPPFMFWRFCLQRTRAAVWHRRCPPPRTQCGVALPRRTPIWRTPCGHCWTPAIGLGPRGSRGRSGGCCTPRCCPGRGRRQLASMYSIFLHMFFLLLFFAGVCLCVC